MLFGVHIDSSYNTLLDQANNVKKMGGNFIQFFVDTTLKNKEKNIYILLKQYLQNNNMQCVIHASYTINLSKTWDEYSSHIHQLLVEIELAELVGAIGVVIHMGKQLDLSKEEAYNNMYTSLLYISNKIKSNILIFLETPAGQGTEICYQIQDFAYFIRKFIHNKNKEICKRFKICLDTCHIFSAGYDLRTLGTIDMYFDTLEELIGLRHIGLVHLNDSKTELGSNVDRHESLGKGMIGKSGIKILVKYFKKNNIPIILETPFIHHNRELKEYFN
jgi:deoxyribonuclease-4